MLTKKTVSIDRTRHEIEQRYQEKERHEFDATPDSRVGQRGERQLLIPNDADDYIIVNTRHGWLKGQFVSQETALPSNSIGQDGEVRTLTSASFNALIYKANGQWYLLDATSINEAIELDIMVLGTRGSAPMEGVTELRVGTGGAIQNG